MMPTWVLWASALALRSLLPLLGPRKLLRNLVLYFRLSPHTPHCQACRLSRPGESSHVQRSMRPALQALASACVRAAADTAYRKAVSLKPVQEKGKLRGHLQPSEGGSYVVCMADRLTQRQPMGLAVQGVPCHLSLGPKLKSCPLNGLQVYTEPRPQLSEISKTELLISVTLQKSDLGTWDGVEPD